MRVGDLVEYESARWLVILLNPQTRMGALLSATGRKHEVPDTLDADEPETLRVVANPAGQWPMIAGPTKRGTGPVVQVVVPPDVWHRHGRELTPWQDWLQADPMREGGTLFFSPEAGIARGDVLLLTYRNGQKGRLTVPFNYGTVAQRKQAAAPKYAPREEMTRYNRPSVIDGDDD
jgi:hypothetical protein